MPSKLSLLLDAFKLSPKEAVAYFRRKGFVLSWDHTDTWGAAHARGFTVAKVLRMDILQSIREEVDRAVADGTSFQVFKNNLIPTLQRLGWWGKAPDPTDPAREVQLGSPYRLRTIFETNVQSAYQAGHWKQAQDLRRSAPYVQYIAVKDSRTRPAHAQLHGKVFHIDDPAWKAIAPPNGYNCRCTIATITAGEMKREGISAEPAGTPIDREVTVSRRTGEVRTVKGVRLSNGTEFFPDAGFDHNAAEAAWQPDLEGYDLDVARQYVQGAITGPDFTRFFKGEVDGVFPVAVLSRDYQDALGAKTRTVHLSGDASTAGTKARQTREKNAEEHPEITIDEWRLLQKIIERPVLVIRQSEQTLAFTSIQGRYYQTAIKVTRDGRELYVTSLRRSSLKDLKQAKRVADRTGKVVLNELEK